ncbi:MAG TPA: hypothetical protein VN618_08950 [Solirubrobacteraceae bacterium]|nr:hypothetical protein [Solirubrobacteraceae bacterium]
MSARIRLLVALGAVLATVPGAARAAGSASPARVRGFAVALAPAPGDLALVELRFPYPAAHAPSTRSSRFSAPAAIGADYLAAATVTHPRGGGRAMLVLAVNRPTSLMDPANVRLTARVPVGLGAVRLLRLTDPISRPPAAPPGLCRLARGGTPPAMSAVFARGARVAGRGAVAAIGEALRLSCGGSASPDFLAAVKGAPATPCGASGGCEPAPAPPAPGPPRCTPCEPKPGFACPLVASPAVCVASQERRGA